MFGSIKPDKTICSKAQRSEYKKYYCGLCCAMGNEFGNLSRFFINYDLTNDYLLSASASDNCIEKRCTCPWSWKRKKVTYIECPEISEYYAKLNYMLVYYKLMDDMLDDNSKKAKFIYEKMHDKATKTETEMSREVELLQKYLNELHNIEKANEHLPVLTVAEKFGMLLQRMVKPKFESDIDEDVFSKINYWTGIWIYTMDAINDCIKDQKKGNYNPITAGLEGNALLIMRLRKQELLDILKTSRSKVLELLDLYPVYENAELIRNLFKAKLPKLVCLYLEVEKDELDA